MVNKNQSNIIVSIITIFIFEYIRSIINFTAELFPNLIMSIILVFILIQINKNNREIKNLGIIGIIIFLLELIRVENINFEYVNHIIISMITYIFLLILTSKNKSRK